MRRLQENGRLQLALDALEQSGATRLELGRKLWTDGQPIAGGKHLCLECGRGVVGHVNVGHRPLVVREWSLRFTPAQGTALLVRRGSLDTLAAFVESWLQRRAHDTT